MAIIFYNVAKELLSCPSQTSKIDIHDLLKQKQMITGGKQALANQHENALLPVHHQMQQEAHSIKEFIIIVVVANTISYLLLMGIVKGCRCGIRYIANMTRQIDNLTNREENP